jgi:hypothetical protein
MIGDVKLRPAWRDAGSLRSADESGWTRGASRLGVDGSVSTALSILFAGARYDEGSRVEGV